MFRIYLGFGATYIGRIRT